jgi:uncharacterized protein YbjT (DUF2867 family)
MLLRHICRGQALGEAAVRGSGLPYVIVRPGGLLDAPGGTSPITVGQVSS